MLAPFKHVLFRYLVMDVYDSIIKRKASTPLHAWVFRSIRWLANSVSDRIIETSEELRETLGKFQSKAVVIFNSPEDPGASVQGILPPTDGPLLMALGGSINMRRMALEPLVRVLDRLGPDETLKANSDQLRGTIAAGLDAELDIDRGLFLLEQDARGIGLFQRRFLEVNTLNLEGRSVFVSHGSTFS